MCMLRRLATLAHHAKGRYRGISKVGHHPPMRFTMYPTRAAQTNMRKGVALPTSPMTSGMRAVRATEQAANGSKLAWYNRSGKPTPPTVARRRWDHDRRHAS